MVHAAGRRGLHPGDHPFPMNKNAQDLMMGAPSFVTQAQADELNHRLHQEGGGRGRRVTAFCKFSTGSFPHVENPDQTKTRSTPLWCAPGFVSHSILFVGAALVAARASPVGADAHTSPPAGGDKPPPLRPRRNPCTAQAPPHPVGPQRSKRRCRHSSSSLRTATAALSKRAGGTFVA